MSAKPDPNSPVVLARFVSPMITLQGVIIGVATLIVFGVVVIPEQVGDIGRLVGIFVCVLFVWLYMIRAWVIEAHSDHLLIIHPFWITRRIPYDQISKARVLADRSGLSLAVYTGSGIWPAALIWIGLKYSIEKEHPVDPLFSAIRQSASLTRFSRTMFGHPTYEREP